MKILRVIRSLDPARGGTVEGIHQMTPHLSRLGFKTSVISLDPPDASWLHNLPFKSYGFGPVASEYGYRRGLPERILNLAQQHDVVIIHGIWHHHAFATWRALKGSSIRYFVYPHGMLDPWFKRTYPLKHLKKWTYWPWADYRVLRDATGVLFTTRRELILARQSFCLYRANECLVGYGTSAPPDNPDAQINDFYNQFPHLYGKRIILSLSRIHPKKGLDLLIDAFASVADKDPLLHLFIAGPGNAEFVASLQQRAKTLGIYDKITWTGMISGNLKWGSFRCAELFCLPSHQENFGIAVAESLSCSTPVLISHPVNISPIIDDNSAGFVDYDTIDGAINLLSTWIKYDDHLKMQMRQAARQCFESNFEIRHCVESISKSIYRSLEVRKLSMSSTKRQY